MSDFDKEAERERLREKYEREEEKREVTERMSELLLKGATMTNAHCQECGDPIFRYDGQEFCATCQRTVQRSNDEAADGAEATEDNGETEEIEVASPSETHVQFGGDAATGTEPAADTDEQPATETTAAPDPDAQTEPEIDQQRDRHSEHEDRDTVRTQATAPVNVEGDLSEASDSLVRSITSLSQRAEGTEDVGRMRDLLAATREAAEALSAVRDAAR